MAPETTALSIELRGQVWVVSRLGIEPSFPASEAGVLPIDDREAIKKQIMCLIASRASILSLGLVASFTSPRFLEYTAIDSLT